MNLFLLSTRFVKSTGMHTSPLHWFLATRLVWYLMRVKRTIKYLALSPLKQSVGRNGKLYRKHAIDASYQVADQLAKRLHRRLNCLKLTVDRGHAMISKWWQKQAWPFVARWANINKRMHNDLPNTTLKIKDWAPWTST